MNAEFAFRLGKASAEVLAQGSERSRFLLASDTRRSGAMLKHALTAGLCARGCEVIDVGVLPTPGISYLCQQEQASAGVVISASHNPFADNGIKFFNGQGEKLSDALEQAIEAKLQELEDLPPLTGKDIGLSHMDDKLQENYFDFLTSQGPDLSGLRIAVDCANGAAHALAPRLFRQLGADVDAMSTEPDGLNINVDCGSTHLQALQTRVRKHSYDLGIAFDGDADRVLMVDSQGEVFDGDGMMALTAIARQESAIVGTIMSNMGVEVFLRDHGVQLLRAQVGDRYVKELLKGQGLTLGGEQSGHLLFLDKAPTGDGMLSGLIVLDALLQSGRELGDWRSSIPRYPQILRNVAIPPERKANIMQEAIIQEVLAEAEGALANIGRVNIRPSGTEALVRLMLEGPDGEQLEGLSQRLSGKLEQWVAQTT